MRVIRQSDPPPPPRKRKLRLVPTEHQEQCALFEWAAQSRGKWPELALLYAIPNGGHRLPAVAGKLKAEGVKKGMLDTCLPCARSGYHGFYVELKSRGRKPTPEQYAWMTALRAQGYKADWYDEWEAARDALVSYLEGRE